MKVKGFKCKYTVVGPRTICSLVSAREGIKVNGRAKCEDTDVFNEEFGRDIARLKAEIKVFNKRSQFDKRRLQYFERMASRHAAIIDEYHREMDARQAQISDIISKVQRKEDA